ncbi:MAG TPA: papain-like cysteine protease family protein [Allosphingosinicella sp.]|jgi:hypothetical protein|uniref:papain-like cysteine protease family protein n=1 Tax=Allosphingosinicella sp. TaxID=2823234 RepID=UPI002F28A089
MTTLSAAYPTRPLTMSAASPRGGAAPILLPFKVQRQGKRPQWCWAAVTSSISGYPNPPHDAPVTMCKIASNELGPNCCATPVPGACDVQNTLDGPLGNIGRLRQPVITGYLGETAVRAELSANLPLPIRVVWTKSGGGGHFCVIYGIRTVGTQLQYAVSDPIYGEASVAHAALIAGGYKAGGGAWSHSYVVKP